MACPVNPCSICNQTLREWSLCPYVFPCISYAQGKDLRIVTFKNVTAAMCSYFGSVPLFGGKGSIVCVEMGQTSSPEKKGLICGLVVFPRKNDPANKF